MKKDDLRKLAKPAVLLFKKVPPNVLTVIGTVIVTVGAVFILTGRFFTAGLIILLGAIFDTIDGEVARYTDKITPFGSFLDSTLDRYADFFIFLCIAIYGKGSNLTILSLVALIGSFITSYTRARAEALGYSLKVGIIQRPERIILIILGLLFGYRVLWWVVLIIAVLANITGLQRIFVFYKQTKGGNNG